MFGNEIEVDESYFGSKRKGQRGRGAAGKISVFGLLKRSRKVYTKIIIVYSDCWGGYNALDISDFKHFRINYSELFADRPTVTAPRRRRHGGRETARSSPPFPRSIGGKH